MILDHWLKLNKKDRHYASNKPGEDRRKLSDSNRVMIGLANDNRNKERNSQLVVGMLNLFS